MARTNPDRAGNWVDAELGLSRDPFASFETWYALAAQADPQPEAVALATVAADGQPAARMVLHRGVSAGDAGPGFRFFTNYESRKGDELAGNDRAALLFYWQPLRRQVRIEGRVERLSAAESDAYFATRDRESQLGAWASHQSAPIADRAALAEALAEARARFGEGPVPRPAHWGGYRLLPRRFEFWHNRPNRLHDRYRFDREGDGWLVRRLSP